MTDILPALAAKPQTAVFHLVEGSLVVLVVPGLVALEELPGQEVAGRQGVRHSPAAGPALPQAARVVWGVSVEAGTVLPAPVGHLRQYGVVVFEPATPGIVSRVRVRVGVRVTLPARL